MSRARLRRLAFALLVLAPFALGVAIAARVSTRVRASLHPVRMAVGAPAGLDSVVSVSLTTSDRLLIRGWYVPPRNGAVVVLGHGWGSQRGAMLPEARALAAHGYGVVLFDWRGHGASGGARTTWGVDEERDLDAVLDFLASRPEVDSARIGALGFSMGGTVVAQRAMRDRRLRAVAVMAAFASPLDEMAHDEGRWGWWSASVAVATLRLSGIDVARERPLEQLCRISPRPLLIVAGTADDDLPVAMARRMFDAACEPKSLWVVPGATHRTYDAVAGPELGRRLTAFFDDALRPLPAVAARGG